MKILRHSELDASGLHGPFDRTVALLEAGNFHGAEVRKLTGGAGLYRARLSDADRLIFRFGRCRSETYLILLEIVRHHDYSASRFLRGATVDESRLVPLERPEAVDPADAVVLPYVNPAVHRVHVLDKILSFDDLQEAALTHRPPLILIGSAGSGKTVLTLQKLRQLPGAVLYVTHSPFLVDNARNLYYAHHYENDDQDVSFLSFLEFVQSISVPAGAPLSFLEFAAWFGRHRASAPVKDAHALYEEFNGVITGSAVTRPYLPPEEYQALGVRRSIFPAEDRPAVYDLFRKYLNFLRTVSRYDLNLVCFDYHAQCKPTYDFVIADEVQDLTAVQLSLILRSLRHAGQFVLCGDANQIVHPNFFSWAGVKTFFHEQRTDSRQDIVRILDANYRNSPEVTDLANRLLLVKNARFGSIDRESHYLVRAVSDHAGKVAFLQDTDAVRRDIDAKTGRSTRFALLVLREEDKPDARRIFRTPLVFSVREAKGLEYENIILLNFVSGNARPFAELAAGVTPEDLRGDFAYGRARDRADKSLEAYKFFVNALYVAVTRAVRNLYVIERTTSHPLLDLLKLRLEEKAPDIAAQTSTIEEWQAEARRLEQQGKDEQVEAIRRSILHTEPVPWPVLTPASLEAVTRDALSPAAPQPKAQRLLLDYAVTYGVSPLVQALARAGFKAALQPDVARHETQQRYAVDYRQRGYRDLHRKIALHGVDFRNPLNQTPLMIATQLGLEPLVEQLVQEGANVSLRDNGGRIPLQLALRAAYLNPLYAKDTLGALYPLLLPAALKVRVGGGLVKIDSHRAEFFVLHSMLALFETLSRVKVRERLPAFETADFVHALASFPVSVIPPYRRQRPYLTSILAGNEVFRAAPGNRRIFLRVQHGRYMPNPDMELAFGDEWVNVCDVLHMDELEREKGNPELTRFLAYLRRRRKELAAARQTPPPPAAAAAPPEPAAAPAVGSATTPALVGPPTAVPPLPPATPSAPAAAPTPPLAQPSVPPVPPLPATAPAIPAVPPGRNTETVAARRRRSTWRDLLRSFAAPPEPELRQTAWDLVPPETPPAREHRPSAPPPASAGPKTSMPRVGRNEPCPCGSGRKFKKCCGR